MSIAVPNNYPTGCNNEEVLIVIKGLSQEMIASGANINTVLRLSPLITAGQVELQKRILEKNHLTTAELHKETAQLKEITKQYSLSSEKFAVASRLISFLALGISILSIIVSIYFGIISNRSDKEWQVEQLKLLKEINLKPKESGAQY